jgi:hypothetical protein
MFIAASTKPATANYTILSSHLISLGPIYLFIRSAFSDAVSCSYYIASNDRVINEKWIWKDVERSGRGRGTIPAFAWRDWAQPWKTSVRIVSLTAEIWIRDLPNTKQEC